MNTPVNAGTSITSDKERSRRDRYYAAQLVLVLSLVLWRALESSPRISTLDGGQFAASTPGRVLAFVCLFTSLIALVCIAWTTWKRWRDPEIAALGVSLLLSLAWRHGFDSFDLVYIAGASTAGLTWFFFRRVR